MKGVPLAKPRPIGLAHSRREISNFAWLSLTNESVEFRGPLEVPWINAFIKLHCYLTKGFERGPLTKPRPIGVDRPKREIPNFAGMSLTEALAGRILRAPLNITGLIHLLNLTVI